MTVTPEKAITQGVSDAFDFFLSQRDMSTFSFIESATRTAVGNWLEEHTADLVDAIAKVVVVSGEYAEPPTVAACRDGMQLVVDCPYCLGSHRHGAVGPNVGDGDGHRVSHCPGRNVGYVIKELARK